jgi:hypothetical protein
MTIPERLDDNMNVSIVSSLAAIDDYDCCKHVPMPVRTFVIFSTKLTSALEFGRFHSFASLEAWLG